jgi:hypothetical protein
MFRSPWSITITLVVFNHQRVHQINVNKQLICGIAIASVTAG